MLEAEKAHLRISLIGAIEDWFKSENGNVNMPWVGDNTLSYIADCALCAILAVQDAQEYLERETSETEHGN